MKEREHTKNREQTTDLAPVDHQEEERREQRQEGVRGPHYHPDVPTEYLLTPDVNNHLMKVYRTLGVTSLLTGLGSLASVFLSPAAMGLASIGGIVAGFGVLFGILLTNKQNVSLREKLLYTFGFLEGLGIAPLISVVTPATIFLALAGTAAIFAGFSIAALKAKSQTFLALGGPLLGALLFLVGGSLVALIGGALGWISAATLSGLHTFYVFATLGVFSLFVSYDTQAMVQSAKQGDKDHVTHSLNMFLNLINIFISLLEILRKKD